MQSTAKTILFIYLATITTLAVTGLLTWGISSFATNSNSAKTNNILQNHKSTIQFKPLHLNRGFGENIVNFVQLKANNETDPNSKFCANGEKKKIKWVVFLIAFFVGGTGADRFYTGYIAQGVFKILTLGGLGIWNLVDWILVLCDKRHEKNGCEFYPYFK